MSSQAHTHTVYIYTHIYNIRCFKQKEKPRETPPTRQVTIEGIKFYGSPWTQCSMAWAATTETSRAERWRHIPEDTDVLAAELGNPLDP